MVLGVARWGQQRAELADARLPAADGARSAGEQRECRRRRAVAGAAQDRGWGAVRCFGPQLWHRCILINVDVEC